MELGDVDDDGAGAAATRDGGAPADTVRAELSAGRAACTGAPELVLRPLPFAPAPAGAADAAVELVVLLLLLLAPKLKKRRRPLRGSAGAGLTPVSLSKDVSSNFRFSPAMAQPAAARGGSG